MLPTAFLLGEGLVGAAARPGAAPPVVTAALRRCAAVYLGPIADLLLESNSKTSAVEHPVYFVIVVEKYGREKKTRWLGRLKKKINKDDPPSQVRTSQVKS